MQNVVAKYASGIRIILVLPELEILAHYDNRTLTNWEQFRALIWLMVFTDKNYNNVWQGSQISQQDGLQTTHQDYSCKNLVSQCPVGPPTPHSLWPQFDSWMPLLKKRLSGILVPNQDQARMRDWLSLLNIARGTTDTGYWVQNLNYF